MNTTDPRFDEAAPLPRWRRGLRRATCALGGALIAAAVIPGAAYAAESTACESLENCYGYSDMQSFYGQVIQRVDQFSRDSYSAMPAPRSYVYVQSGESFPVPSCGEANSMSYMLCRADDTVYIGQDQLWRFYAGNGDAAAAFGIAHEWGHHVQLTAGVFDLVGSRQDMIDAENQADCTGGAFLGYMDAQGQLESDDVDDVNSVLPAIASAEGPERDHGTVEERANAAHYGFTNGLDGCSAVFPGAPLRTST